MKFEYVFKGVRKSTPLTAYADSLFSKLKKFETKPMAAHFKFYAEKHDKCVDVHVTGPDLDIHASAHSDDFYETLDVLYERVSVQMAKKKHKTQDHRGYFSKFDRLREARNRRQKPTEADHGYRPNQWRRAV